MIILNQNSAKTITQEELKNRMHYCQETGIFTWINCNKYHSEKNNSKAERDELFGEFSRDNY